MQNDSLIGYAYGVLNDPLTADSFIGYVSGFIYNPGSMGDSAIGYSSATLQPPHHPIGTWNGTTIVWGPVTTWDGDSLV